MPRKRKPAEDAELPPEAADGSVSLTGKQLRRLPTASEAGANLSRVALDLITRAVPDDLVREVVTHSAPMARLGGRTHAGAIALSQALKLLSQPPAARQPVPDLMTLEEIGKRLGRSRTIVADWAKEDLLGEPVQSGRGKKWNRDGLERARLVDYLLRHGVARAEIVEAARGRELPMLVLSQTLAGRATLTRKQVSRSSGVPEELVAALTQALGVASGEQDEAVYTEREVQAIRLLGALRSVYTDDDLLEVASVVGRAMHEVAEATLELFRRRFAKPFAEAGASELELMLRLATVIDLTVPTTGPMLELVLRRQLEVTGRAEAITHLEMSGDLDGQVELAVGFADIVGFTAASTAMNALEVSQLAANLLRAAERAFAPHGARIVKTMGDAVMFTAADSVNAAAAAAELMREWARDAERPPLRVGIAFGPMLRAYADYFGRTVNVASRLGDAAPGGAIYVARQKPAIPAARWAAAGLRSRPGGEQTLKGIDGRVAVLEVSAMRYRDK
ncbi:MAG: adenylate cyclase regulatory domain-containing protein [Candidatus Dormibacteria bacterium]